MIEAGFAGFAGFLPPSRLQPASFLPAGFLPPAGFSRLQPASSAGFIITAGFLQGRAQPRGRPPGGLPLRYVGTGRARHLLNDVFPEALQGLREAVVAVVAVVCAAAVVVVRCCSLLFVVVCCSRRE